MRLLGPINSGIGAGGNNAATNNYTTTFQVVGRVAGIYVRYNHTCPAGTDVTVSTVGTSPAIPTQTLLSLVNANTDGLFLPRVLADDIVGAELSDLTSAEPIAISDFVKVLIAQANNGDSVDVWLLLE